MKKGTILMLTLFSVISLCILLVFSPVEILCDSEGVLLDQGADWRSFPTAERSPEWTEDSPVDMIGTWKVTFGVAVLFEDIFDPAEDPEFIQLMGDTLFVITAQQGMCFGGKFDTAGGHNKITGVVLPNGEVVIQRHGGEVSIGRLSLHGELIMTDQSFRIRGYFQGYEDQYSENPGIFSGVFIAEKINPQ